MDIVLSQYFLLSVLFHLNLFCLIHWIDDLKPHTTVHTYLLWWKNQTQWKQFSMVAFLPKATILFMWTGIPIFLVKRCMLNIFAILDTRRCVDGKGKHATGTSLLVIMWSLMWLGAMKHQSLTLSRFVIDLLFIPARTSLFHNSFKISPSLLRMNGWLLFIANST